MFASLLVLQLACRAPNSRPPRDERDASEPFRAGRAAAERFARGRVLVLGDSITQDGRWVSFLEYELVAEFPGLDFDIVSIGLASETCSGLSEADHAGGAFPRPCLFERLGRALAEVRPATVIACYGMNDGIYLPLDEARFAAFRAGITRLAADVAAAEAELVLVTPPVFDPASHRPLCDAPYQQTLSAYAVWETTSPPPSVARVVDLHTSMLKELTARRRDDPHFTFAGDGVHPDDLGHMVFARAILSGLAVQPREPSAELALAAARSDPRFALVDERRRLRSDAWLAHVGYTRESHVAPHTGDLARDEQRAADLRSRVRVLRPR